MTPSAAGHPAAHWRTAAQLHDRGRRPAGLFGRLLRLVGPVGGEVDGGGAAAPDPRWIAALCLGSAACLLAIAVSHHGGYRERPWGAPLLWAGFAALYLPVALRAAWPATARGERVALVLLLAVSSLAAKVLYAPTSFAHFDEFLHWATALDIVETRRLFAPNPLLPISPLYPGLELVTTALVEMTGLPIFASAVIVLVALRALLAAALFALYERVGGSARLAAVACLAYMGNSGFVLFDAQFAYESLALVLFVCALLAVALFEDERSPKAAVGLGLVAPFFAALAVTHHITAYFAAAIVSLLAVLVWAGSARRGRRTGLLVVAALALLLPTAWSWILGNPSAGYLGPILEKGSEELERLVSGASGTRRLFVLPGGQQTPVWLRAVSVLSLLVIAVALATGFMRTLAMAVRDRGGWPALGQCLRLRWSNPWVVLLALLSIGLPVSVGFRLTSAGWQIGNRMGPFVFLGVGFVAAVGIVRFWQTAGARWWSAAGTGLALTVVFVGGVVTGWGVPAHRTPYMVSADAPSVEPMGVEASLWAKEWLGEGNRFASDRANRLLLATYGRQRVLTTLHDGIDTSHLFLGPSVSAGEIDVLKRGRIDYLLADLRLTTALPTLGHYYEETETYDGPQAPPDPENLLKLNGMRRVDRVFDNGYIVVFGTGRLRDAP